ncbi:tripartite tricarboxylate transporter TctB family protein [Salinicola sp. LHM]|jgi:putative tricarboxylic transport membrane protein|uniref:tripartite tricarboxylate transporter TctB family protein n=1 Tax=Salinicola TaxID=404432 RepID=UPI000DA1B333|nr:MULTISPECIES: tripartite tricarboxylate transporter TctB family protein [Salinicola]MEC8916389.1 tripartite tricarboxylate transporter TctB family protein [Pseudomonadota bacterium]MED5501026.1 tripartite tricarboxylate transporter TctB family protein [Pseudomonadota bacterium]WQH34641.1 tripartite tricarboxylate transporter TctB family protein [Salinicola sp. LHM]
MSKFNDRVFGLVMLVIAVAYYYGATQFPVPFGGSEAVGPETFPKLLAVILAICSLYMIVKPDPDNHWPASRTFVELGIAVVTLIVYALLLEPLGFIVSTTLAVGTLCWRMGARPIKAYLTGLISGVVVFVLFTYGLELPLPLGLLEMN